jgi:PAS domain S-box-containing protein
LITSQPIITSKNTGPIRGTIILGRDINSETIAKLARFTRLSLRVQRLDSPQLPADFQVARRALLGEQTSNSTLNSILVRPHSEDAIAGYTILKDLYGKPALLLRVETPRTIYQQGQSSQRYLILFIAIVGLTFGGVTLLLIERLVTIRLSRLSIGVSRLAKHSDLKARLYIKGNDELSNLASNINQMLAALEDSQRQQQENQQRWGAVVQQVSEGIYLLDAKTRRIIEANSAFAELLGYTTAEILNLTIYDFVALEREAIDRQIERILAEKHHYIRERCYRRQDGSCVDVEASVSVIADRGREVLCVVLRDITERKQVEEALRQAEEKYRQIFENATEGIYQISKQGRYISANPALARLYGYSSAAELMANVSKIGQQLYVDPDRYARFLNTVEKNNIVSRFVAQIYRQDRSTIWVAEYVRAVRDSGGELLHYEGTVEDITDRKIVAEALRYQQEQSENLLLNILPAPIAARLKLEENTIADSFADVTVLFADLVGFTQISAQIPPTELVSLLNDIFSTFDQLAERHGLEKIKTIGDAYMVAGGLPIKSSDHAEAIAEMALDMQAAIAQFNTRSGKAFDIRIGINTGAVVAGVIGIKRLIYDLWGDTVNIASRMESQGIPGQIQVTSTTYQRLRDKYTFEYRGEIQVKGKGEMMTYLLTGKKVSAIACGEHLIAHQQ